MGDFRTRYGSAIGPYGTASSVSGGMVLSIDDTTPDVTDGTFFLAQNTAATTITYFDVREPGGGVSAAHTGKRITILANNNLTTIQNAGQIFRSSTGAALTSGQTISFVYFNSAWYEEGFSLLGREHVKTVTVAGATLAPNVAGARLLLVTNTAASTIVGLSGGTIGQELWIGKSGVSAGTGLTLQAANNLWLAGTGAFVMSDSALYSFFCDNGSRFRQVSAVAITT